MYRQKRRKSDEGSRAIGESLFANLDWIAPGLVTIRGNFGKTVWRAVHRIAPILRDHLALEESLNWILGQFGLYLRLAVMAQVLSNLSSLEFRSGIQEYFHA
jgi:hypothetical protein